ncbi:MAG: redoxin domain-containing protein [Bacteroidetes bacterium]|nr:redoxin domain-containing protein [Bacteroidota bacterium]MDA1224490.1 redoxin domain-containing protein [Bacteroidota bacterium]
MSIQIGSIAPDFTLFNSEKQEVTLSQYLGKSVVLLFYPQAFTGVCTTELCDIRDNLNVYSTLNAEILAISVDSVFTLENWKQQQGFNFQMLSDFNKTVSTAYETMYETFAFGMKGVSKRSAFVVDSKGILRYVEILDNAGEIPNLDKIKEVLATL